ncbi:MAG: hypothetical protein LBI33_10445, partial [Propionibacteriaceae bacterium]|nr:hypothetical protein [Propionibacteriaceae bacterium]
MNLSPSERTISTPYLIDGPTLFVAKRSKPLSPTLPEIGFGSQPIDGGNLVVEPRDYAAAM